MATPIPDAHCYGLGLTIFGVIQGLPLTLHMSVTIVKQNSQLGNSQNCPSQIITLCANSGSCRSKENSQEVYTWTHGTLRHSQSGKDKMIPGCYHSLMLLSLRDSTYVALSSSDCSVEGWLVVTLLWLLPAQHY